MGNPKKSSISEEDNNLDVRGYKISYVKVLLTCTAVVLSCGLFWIFLSWRKTFWMQCTHTSCSLKVADKVLIVDIYGQQFVSRIQHPRCSSPSRHQHPYFYYKRMKYNWNETECKFINTRGLDIKLCSELLKCTRGLNSEEVIARREIYGSNSIDIEVKPIINLVLREIKNPYYLYQSFCVLVWCAQSYFLFPAAMVFLTIISVAVTVWETRKQSRTLRDAMQLKSMATVLRDGKEVETDSKNLCPGDVVVFPQSSFTMYCDAVLLSGTCVVNESMLTGESIPITKVPLSVGDLNAVFDPMSEHKKSVLSCGTEVLLSRSVDDSGVRAVVYRTGFSTAKGELVRAILYPKPVKLELYSDFFKCGFVCLSIGISSLIYLSLVGIKLNAYPLDIALTVFNIVTFFFPSAVSGVLTSINAQAQRRLRQQGIFCLNSRYIHFAGGLDVVCFDKTGTLTGDSLELLAAVPVREGKFENAVENIETMSSNLLLTAMATCHSLSRIKEKLVGYDLDIKMFNATGWELQETTSETDLPFDFRPPITVFPKNFRVKHQHAVGILKQFPFESVLRKTSVVTYSEGAFRSFVKGAPELVVSLCKTDTVPRNSKEVIDHYSSSGYRIIGMSTKLLEKCVTPKQALEISRDDLEAEMNFLGLIILENKLKIETIPTLNVLKEANIRSVMVTGDNLLTAITVGRKCGIVDESDSLVIIEANLLPPSDKELSNLLTVSYILDKSHLPLQRDIPTSSEKNTEAIIMYLETNCCIAIEGTTFNILRIYDLNLLEKIVVKGAIFARMLPEDKLFLIEHFQNLGYQVGMCGDGANDCGALKTAHTGVSLSVAEVSVAAPFTSKYTDIRCMPTLIREGRATLVSTFDAFKYMICYAYTFLIVVNFLFWDGQRPSDGAYLFIDIVLNLAPPFLFGATTAFSGLAKKRPPRSFLSFVPLFSLFSFLTIQVGMLLLAYSYCRLQPWYEPFTFHRDSFDTPASSHSGTTLLSMNMMAYVTAATAFASGPPYRNGFFSNKKLVGLLTAEFVLITLMILYPPDFMVSFLNFKRAPDFRYQLCLYGIALGGFIFIFIYEKYFVQGLFSQYVVPYLKQRRGPVKKYEKLQESLRDWPPIEDLKGQVNQKAK